MANEHTATAPDGTVFKRTSQNRTYTHAVLGRFIATDGTMKWAALSWCGDETKVPSRIREFENRRFYYNVIAVPIN